jgi:hypothetical protein
MVPPPRQCIHRSEVAPLAGDGDAAAQQNRRRRAGHHPHDISAAFSEEAQ